jgi:P4 family phage/plasmid primase-like protien
VIKVSVYEHKRDNEPKLHELESFEELAHELGQSGAGHAFRIEKDGFLFSPGEILAGHVRANKNTILIHFGVLDLDDLTGEELADVRGRLEGLSRVLYTTWKHGEAQAKGLNRYRVVLELSRPVRADEWADFWPRMVTRFSASRDEACKDPSRMYYAPSMPIGDEDLAVFERIPGEPLNVDEVLLDPDPGIPMGKRAAKLRSPVTPENRRKPVSDKARRWAQKRLEDHADAIRAVPFPGPIYPTLNKAAFMAGQLCPHLLDEGEAAIALLDAAQERNPEPAFADKYIGIIEAGMLDGMGDPWFPEPRYPLTDSGNAERVADQYGRRIRHVGGWGKWLVWDGSRWVLEGADAHVAQLVKESIRSVKQEAARVEDVDARKKMFAWSVSCESAGRRAAAEKLASVEPEIAISHIALDSDPWLFCCANGTLDLRTGELLEHDPADLITKRSPVAYNADADCPTWDRFLEECMGGDEELARYVQKAVGYSLTGSVREHVLFFLHGAGANGKSTFVNLVLELLGDYGVVGAPDLLLAKNGNAHPTEQTDLSGARLVSCQEVEQGRTWAEATLKQLTGGDPIKARRMREDFWTFLPTHKFWISGNSKPNVRGTDAGIWRRMRLIPFEVSFLGREDRDLKTKLEAELEGILAWAVRGCGLWLREGLTPPRKVLEATEAYREEQDSLGLFLHERCELEEDGRVSRAQLRLAYDAWCRDQGEKFPLSPRALASALRERGVKDTTVQLPGKPHPERGWAGLKLRAGAAPGSNLVRVAS